MTLHLIAIPFLLVGFDLLFGMVIVPYFTSSTLKETGIQVLGKVVQLDEDDGAYWPTVQYRTLEGETRYFKPAGASKYKDLLNRSVPVIYNPNKAQDVIMLHKNQAFEYKLFSIIGGAALLLGIILWFALP
jgi:hypothetical protein